MKNPRWDVDLVNPANAAADIGENATPHDWMLTLAADGVTIATIEPTISEGALTVDLSSHASSLLAAGKITGTYQGSVSWTDGDEAVTETYSGPLQCSIERDHVLVFFAPLDVFEVSRS